MPTYRPGAGTWLRTASSEERIFAAEYSILACNAAGEELVRIALSLDMDVPWGERDDSLRARVLWRARYYHRVRHVEASPQVIFRWWARLVNRLPQGLRPAARRFVDGWRRR